MTRRKPLFEDLMRMKETVPVRVLTDEENVILTFETAIGRGPQGITEQMSNHVLNWAQGVLVEHALLEACLDGRIVVTVDDEGDIAYTIGDDDSREAIAKMLVRFREVFGTSDEEL